MKRIRISNFFLTEKSKTFIVAEVGLNHNGKIELAKEIIREAKKCNATAVKFQAYKTGLFINKKYAPDQYKLLKKYELSYDDLKTLKEFSDKNDIIFFASCFDTESADFLFKLKIPIIKIASGELSNAPLLNRIAHFQIPLFISTGLHDLREIKKTIARVEKINNKIVIMHCVSEYPLKYENANLNVIKLYHEIFNYLIGLSDHSGGDHSGGDRLLSTFAAISGVKVIEKHFTLDNNLPGPDHGLAMNPLDFKAMVGHIRLIEKSPDEQKKAIEQNIKLYKISSGKKRKVLTEIEKKIRPHALKGIYARRDIMKGEFLSEDNLIIQRPFKGLKPVEFITLEGKRAQKKYKKYEII